MPWNGRGSGSAAVYAVEGDSPVKPLVLFQVSPLVLREMAKEECLNSGISPRIFSCPWNKEGGKRKGKRLDDQGRNCLGRYKNSLGLEKKKEWR